MPIVYIHGVAVRDQGGNALEHGGNQLLERLLEQITWEMVEPRLRRFIAPAVSQNPEQVPLIHAYWGDQAAKLAWDGASCLPKETSEVSALLPIRFPNFALTNLMIDLRHPLNQLVARLFGDVFCYLNNRGDSDSPGPIVQRILAALSQAQKAKDETGEPIVVLSNSMGGQIMYDVATYFLPLMPEYTGVSVDYWCSVAAQIGLFEELKLFLCSSPAYSKANGNRVPFPNRRHLGVWWNVWDVDDIISYSVRDIIEGVDDTSYRVGQPLLKEHVGYLQEESFYKLFAERLRQAFGTGDAGEKKSG